MIRTPFVLNLVVLVFSTRAMACTQGTAVFLEVRAMKPRSTAALVSICAESLETNRN